MKNTIVRGWLGRRWLVAVLLLVAPATWFCAGSRALGDEPVIYRGSYVRWRLGFFRRSGARPVFPIRSDRRVTAEWQPVPVVAAVPSNEPAKQAESAEVAQPSAEPAKQAGRAGVAKSLTETGSIVRREAAGKPWQAVAKDAALQPGDLLIGLPGAALQSNDGKVRLSFRPDMTGTAPLPIIETAVVLDESKADLGVTLDRGRIILANTAKEGAAQVRLRIRDKTGLVTLKAPGAQLGIELYGRWPAGSPFHKDGGSSEGPALSLIFLVLQGEVDIKGDRRQFALTAPPGPAMLEWDSVSGEFPSSPHHLDQLPDWAKGDATPEVREKLARRDELVRLIATKSVPEAIASFLSSDDLEKRRIAVMAMGATDDLRGLANALANAKHLDVWNNGVIALRHWIGRGPGQDQKLYKGLVDEGKYKPVDAEAVLQLLHGFSDADLARPETYETLIDYLAHSRLALRGLAYWHLYRLVPAGRDLGYNPLDEKNKRQAAIAKWQKLVPRGELPKQGKTGSN